MQEKLDWKDVLTRAAWTFVQSAASVLVLSDLSSSRTALIAGGGAVLSLIKTVAAQQLGTSSDN